jgi:hypothetical protein
MNGEMLRPENGYPLRLVVPGIQGVSWVKWLRRIEVGDMKWATVCSVKPPDPSINTPCGHVSFTAPTSLLTELSGPTSN